MWYPWHVPGEVLGGTWVYSLWAREEFKSPTKVRWLKKGWPEEM